MSKNKKTKYKGFGKNSSISDWGRVVVKSESQYMIVENFLNPEHFKLIKDKVTSDRQLWHLNTEVSYDNGQESESIGLKRSYGMNFTYLHPEDDQYMDDRNSTAYVYALNEQIKKFCNLEEGTKVLRSRLDMTTYRGEETFTFSPHIDLNYIPHLTSIFYFNTTNAPTILYNEIKYDSSPIDENQLTVMEEVECIENRMVIFYGNHIHTGKCLTDKPIRILLNTNFSIPSLSEGLF